MQLKSPYIISRVYVWTKHGGSCRLGTRHHQYHSEELKTQLTISAETLLFRCWCKLSVHHVLCKQCHLLSSQNQVTFCLSIASIARNGRLEGGWETAGAASKRKSVPWHTFRMIWGRQTSDGLYEEWLCLCWMDSQNQNTREENSSWKSRRTPDSYFNYGSDVTAR